MKKLVSPVSSLRKSNPASEYTLLCYIVRQVLDENEKFTVFEHVKPEWFEGKDMREVYDICLLLNDKKETVDISTVFYSAHPSLYSVLCEMATEDIDRRIPILETLGFPDTVSSTIDDERIDIEDVPLNSASVRVITENMLNEVDSLSCNLVIGNS